eukprot:CAMPEP_0194290962 /NCGR_PEP_ID=MMETSP0169-20130528/42450_1 /TAXON_ID=218684 /ORGANISM="Corethron pennatum, Strain L29A3" /LENGTH=390 /DNA_ID=CAMNT_0039038709 /DNA_START=51 /DNA_END=1223 /DNA_ORIENTATION=+
MQMMAPQFSEDLDDEASSNVSDASDGGGSISDGSDPDLAELDQVRLPSDDDDDVDDDDASSSSESDAGAPAHDIFSKIDQLEKEDDRPASMRRSATDDDGTARLKRDALAVRAAIDAWHRLVEARILVQRCLNRRDSVFGDDDDVSEKAAARRRKKRKGTQAEGEERRAICDLADESLDMLSELRRAVDPSPGGGPEAVPAADAASRLAASHTCLVPAWSASLLAIQSDLRLRAGGSAASTRKFAAVDGGLWEQVEATVAHDRLMRASSGAGAAPAPGGALGAFDDSRAYQALLKDFLSSRASADAAAAHGGGGKAASDALEDEARRGARRKKKQAAADAADVDRRASKGRRIRYVEHPKLVNFCFPVPRAEPAVPDDVFIRSIFGGARG